MTTQISNGNISLLLLIATYSSVTFFSCLILISQSGSISVQVLSRNHQDSWSLFTPTWLSGNQTEENSDTGQGS